MNKLSRLFVNFVILIPILILSSDISYAELLKKQGFLINVPNTMEIIPNAFPLIIAKIKTKDKDFPTVTITLDSSYKETSSSHQVYEDELKTTYENLGLTVKSSKYLKEQNISNIKTKLFKVEYIYNNKYFASLVNIFRFNDKTHYITTINKIKDQSQLDAFLQFQEDFLKNISLEKDQSSSAQDTTNYTALNILLGIVFLLAGFLLYINKNKTKHNLQ